MRSAHGGAVAGRARRAWAAGRERGSAGESTHTTRPARGVPLPPPRHNLFTVGDAQQSIYRFRHADVELFEDRGERLEATGDRATLRTNFRSRREILDVLNAA